VIKAVQMPPNTIEPSVIPEQREYLTAQLKHFILINNQAGTLLLKPRSIGPLMIIGGMWIRQ
jgi:hypothetical protein